MSNVATVSQSVSLLLELQLIDAEIVAFNKELSRLPLQLKEAEDSVLNAENELIEITETQKKLQLEIRTREGDTESLKESINTHRTQLGQIKNNSEYTLALSTIKKEKDRISEIEDEVLTRMSDLEALTSQKDEIEKKIKELRTILDEQKTSISKDEKSLEKKITIKKSARTELAEKIEDDTQRRYNRVRQNYPTDAICAVTNQTCQGCYMGVTKQVYSELCMGYEILECPTCGRILHITPDQHPDEVKKQEEEAKKAKKKKAAKKKTTKKKATKKKTNDEITDEGSQAIPKTKIDEKELDEEELEAKLAEEEAELHELDQALGVDADDFVAPGEEK
jgi:predicted  nucleic acid-binding Zn-ribbon protein